MGAGRRCGGRRWHAQRHACRWDVELLLNACLPSCSPPLRTNLPVQVAVGQVGIIMGYEQARWRRQQGPRLPRALHPCHPLLFRCRDAWCRPGTPLAAGCVLVLASDCLRSRFSLPLAPPGGHVCSGNGLPAAGPAGGWQVSGVELQSTRQRGAVHRPHGQRSRAQPGTLPGWCASSGCKPRRRRDSSYAGHAPTPRSPLRTLLPNPCSAHSLTGVDQSLVALGSEVQVRRTAALVCARRACCALLAAP